MKNILLIGQMLALLLLAACNNEGGDSKNAGGTYISPSVNYKGQYRKGYVRKSVSTDKNAIKNRSRSKYYYRTRGKYRKD